MKHLAKIQSEFLKYAANWDELSYDAQKEYLQKHPKSKRKLTAKPGQSGADISELKEKITRKKDDLNSDKVTQQLHDVIDQKRERLLDKPEERSVGAQMFPLVRQQESRRNFFNSLELPDAIESNFAKENNFNKKQKNTAKSYIGASLKYAVDLALENKSPKPFESNLKTSSLQIPYEVIKKAANDSNYEINDDEAKALSEKVSKNLGEILKHDLRFMNQTSPKIEKTLTVDNWDEYENVMHQMFDDEEWERLGLEIGEDTSGEIPDGAPALTTHDEYADYAYENKEAIIRRFKEFGMNVDIYDGGDEMYVYGKDKSYFKFKDEDDSE